MATKEELEKALAEAEAQIERLLRRCELLDQIADLFGLREASDEDLFNALADVATRLSRPADERNEIEQQAGTNDPRLIKLWIEAHKAE